MLLSEKPMSSTESSCRIFHVDFLSILSAPLRIMQLSRSADNPFWVSCMSLSSLIMIRLYNSYVDRKVLMT